MIHLRSITDYKPRSDDPLHRELAREIKQDNEPPNRRSNIYWWLRGELEN